MSFSDSSLQLDHSLSRTDTNEISGDEPQKLCVKYDSSPPFPSNILADDSNAELLKPTTSTYSESPDDHLLVKDEPADVDVTVTDDAYIESVTSPQSYSDTGIPVPVDNLAPVPLTVLQQQDFDITQEAGKSMIRTPAKKSFKSGKRRHVCPYCQHAFKVKAGLDRHIPIHTGEKPFQCPNCDRRFAQKCQLRNHITNKHGDVSDRPFACPHCGYRCLYISILKKHISSVHKEVRPFKCEKCLKTFAQSASLKDHVANNH